MPQLNEPVIVSPKEHALLVGEPPTPKDDGFVSPLEDPEGVSRAVEKALANSNPLPDAEPPPDTQVTLPGGMVRGDHVISTVEVKELTGEDEEVMARAAQAQPGNIFHFINILLEAGTVRFGSEDEKQTKKLLKSALVGDRDAILLGIRRATYGDTIDLNNWQCPSCQELSDLEIPLADIPITESENIREDGEFDIKLRNGRVATVRLANGADQLAVFEERKLVTAERDSLLLSRCLISIKDPDGTDHTVAGLGLGTARSLGAKDRHAILETLSKKQPGPRFDGIKVTHDTCGKEVELLIGISDLFPDFLLV